MNSREYLLEKFFNWLDKLPKPIKYPILLPVAIIMIVIGATVITALSEDNEE